MSRRRQLLAVTRLEMERGLSPLRSLWLLFLAFAPAIIIAGHAFEEHTHRLDEETLILAGIVQFFYVRFGIFFGCLGIFLRLLRGELAERTLHYPLLAPLRREVLVAGKFLAGALTAILVFGAGVLASSVLMYGHFDAGREFALHGPGLAHIRAYLLVSTLACLGYGALFLALSLVFRNPIVPAVIALLWEGINGILPVWLKHLSVTFYLKPLFPVELPIEGISGLFTVAAEPTPAWLAVTGLVLFAAAVVAFACWRVRRLEISYSSD
jgi:ABC-type transport system involved in multi-copper enzyme maturation permease subunit